MVLSRARSAVLGAAALSLAAAAGAGQKPPPLAAEYVIRAAPGEDLLLPPPQLPDLRGYTGAAVLEKVPRGPRGRAVIRRMVEIPTLHEFVGGGGRLREWAARQTSNPRAVLIEGGVMTPRDLARTLGKDVIVETAPGVFVLRLPLVVTQGATLHIDSKVKEFRMSQERGAFLSNDGLTFITGTRLLAWREKDGAPATFRHGDEFRPFVISWGGSQLYIADSTVAHLGYSASKAYGVSISQYSPHMHARLRQPRPTGWIVHSEFVDNWYGFYCYEADDVAIVGNTYRDNIVYGIDPHDRSRGCRR